MSARLPTRWLVVAVLTCLLSPVVSVLISVEVNSRTAAEAERQRAAQSQEVRRVVCSVATSQMDAFAEAQSPTGQASYQAWLDLHKISNCPPMVKRGFTMAEPKRERPTDATDRRRFGGRALYTLPIRDNALQLDGWTFIPEADPVCRARVISENHLGSRIVYVEDDGSITLSNPDDIEVDYTLEG